MTLTKSCIAFAVSIAAVAAVVAASSAASISVLFFGFQTIQHHRPGPSEPYSLKDPCPFRFTGLLRAGFP
eukprot:10858212-Karenia_brevis.AAC.1